MTTQIMQSVIHAEEQVNEVCMDYKNPYNLPMASIWVKNDFGQMVCRINSPDVYELLDSPDTLAKLKDTEFFGILTCGWAAPISTTDDDTPPSKAKGRRRVRLFVSANNTGAVSILRFEDTPGEIITDAGQARGSLADAVMDLYWKKKELEIMGDTK